MGLISYIKRLYYNRRIDKADQLLRNGNEREAECIYISLLRKQYSAVDKLAKLYNSQCDKAISENDTETEILLFRNIVDLRIKGGDNYDVSLYNTIVEKTLRALLASANSLFDSGNYQKCSDVLSSINETDWKCSESINLACESIIQNRILIVNNSKYSSQAFLSAADQLIDAFNSLGKGIKRSQKAVVSFINELVSIKRYLAANYFLERFKDANYNNQCLKNAVLIIDSNDSEASANDVKDTALKYGKELMFNVLQSQDERLRIFNQCWKVTSSDEWVISVLDREKTDAFQKELVDNILHNHCMFFSKEYMCKSFIDWILKLSEVKETLNLLEKMHKLGYEVKNEYIKKFDSFISTIQFGERIPYINNSLNLFENDELLLKHKLECANWYFLQNKYDESISICDEIGNVIVGTDIVKTKAIYKKALAQKELDKKVELLKEAYKTLSQKSRQTTDSLLKSINEAFIDTAELYYASNEYQKAYSILYEQAKQGSVRALSLITDYRLGELRACDKEKKETTVECYIAEIKSFNNAIVLSFESYRKLWDELTAAVVEKTNNLDNKESIDEYEKLIFRIEQEFQDKDVVEQKKSFIIRQLINKKYLFARETEMSKDFSAAANYYREISALEKSQSPTLAVVRYVICRLKGNLVLCVTDFKNEIYNVIRNTSDTFNAEKKDIAYRFALGLLKSGEVKESLSVLSEFLPEEIKLKKACEQKNIEIALEKLDDFNNRIDMIMNRTLSSDDAINFINHMLDYAEVIKPVLDIPRSVLAGYRDKIKNYAISKLFDEEKYCVAFDKLKKVHSNYLDDLTDLRNLAVICMNIVESGQLNNLNYKEVIAIWLTAIYQEKIFVKSLDYTSWDDNYTFSLHNAFGNFNEYEVEDIPENINFEDECGDNLVMIRDVQRILIDRFEAAISENQDYHLFFTEQKNSMDALIALNLDIKCRLVAPYLSSMFKGIYEEINEAIEHEREAEYDNWEDVLAVGADYELQDSIYSDYSNAKNCCDDCIEALDSRSLSCIRNAFANAKLELIGRFNNKNQALISYARSNVSSLSVDNKDDFNREFDLFYIVCNGIKDATLSYSFSNFVMRFVVGEVNEKRLSIKEASVYIIAIHLLDRSNSKVVENLSTLLSMLMQEYVQEGNSTILMSIKDILSKTRHCDSSLNDELIETLFLMTLISNNEGRLSSLSSSISSYSSKTSSFSQKLNAKVSEAKINKELNDIVEKVNNNTIKKYDALTRLYDIYVKYPNNTRVCENLATLCDMCIMEYIIGDTYGSSKVKSVLDKLKNNRSSEFCKRSKVFKQSHSGIWDNLDYDNKCLLKGTCFRPGVSLNGKGYALKEGLEYYEKLGGFICEDPYTSTLHLLRNRKTNSIF